MARTMGVQVSNYHILFALVDRHVSEEMTLSQKVHVEQSPKGALFLCIYCSSPLEHVFLYDRAHQTRAINTLIFGKPVLSPILY